MQVEEELVAPACCSGVGLGGKGNEDRDRFTKRGAEEGLPEGEVLQVPARGLQARAPNLFSRHKYFLLLSSHV